MNPFLLRTFSAARILGVISMIQKVLVAGSGSAGLIAALSLGAHGKNS